MSDLYRTAIDILDIIVIQFGWTLIMCILYRHFFRLKFLPASLPAALIPGVVWLGVRQLINSLIVITFSVTGDNVKSLLKQLLIYGSLFLISCLFYQGNRKLRLLITMMYMAVSEIGRFLSFSMSIFWPRLYDLCYQWFDRAQDYSEASVKRFVILIECLGFFQQLSYGVIFLAVIYGSFRYVCRACKDRELPLHRTEFLFLMLPCTSSFLLCTLLRIIMYTSEDTIPKTVYESFPALIGIVPFLLILSLLSILYSVKLYQEMLTLNEERNRRAVLEKQIVSMEEHARELERLYSGVRSMKHDMKNQLAVLGSLIERQDREELPGYLEQLNQTLGKLDVPFQTGSTVVDSLLSMKYHEICEKLPHLRFEAEGLVLPKECRIQPTDLCIILGNALDNAIEACERSDTQAGQDRDFIRLYSRYCREMLLLTVENSFHGELKLIRGNAFPSTTKPDGNSHGIGMHNIGTAARRYQGDVSWRASENVFSLTVMLNNGVQPDQDFPEGGKASGGFSIFRS